MISGYPDEEASVPWSPHVYVPGYKKLASWTAKTVARQLFKPVSEEAKAHPQIQLNYGETNWWTLSKFDSALATNAEGTGLFWYRRDPEQLKSKLAQAAKLHVQLVTSWEKLREQCTVRRLPRLPPTMRGLRPSPSIRILS